MQIRINLWIQAHSMLYKLSPIQKHQEKNWPCHKGQPRVIIWKKPQGMGIQPVGTSSGSILKLLLFPSFCTSSRKNPFCLIILYDILFYFIHVYQAPGQEEKTLGDILLCKQKGLITLITGYMFQTITLPSVFMHIFFMILYIYLALRQGQTTH